MSRKALTLTFTIPLPTLETIAAALRALPRGAARLLVLWQRRADERVRLLAMDERMRRDIGITLEEQLIEGHKPFWRP